MPQRSVLDLQDVLVQAGIAGMVVGEWSRKHCKRCTQEQALAAFYNVLEKCHSCGQRAAPKGSIKFEDKAQNTISNFRYCSLCNDSLDIANFLEECKTCLECRKHSRKRVRASGVSKKAEPARETADAEFKRLDHSAEQLRGDVDARIEKMSSSEWSLDTLARIEMWAIAYADNEKLSKTKLKFSQAHIARVDDARRRFTDRLDHEQTMEESSPKVHLALGTAQGHTMYADLVARDILRELPELSPGLKNSIEDMQESVSRLVF